MSNEDIRVIYVSHPASGLGRSNFPVVCHVKDGRIVRTVPYEIPDDVRLYDIETTSRGNFQRSRKEVQMPLAYGWKQRIHTNRVGYPLLRDGWSPDNPNPEGRGRDTYSRVSWDQALDVVAQQLESIAERFGSMESVLVQADGHGQSGYLHSMHFWGHYLFDVLREQRGWGWWTQQLRNPDSWEGYYWGAKHVWGFDATLGEPYQDAVWDDVLEHSELVLFSGNDPEATGLGMSGSSALDMVDWLKRAGIKIIAISPDLNYAGAVNADKWIPIQPNTDAALYLGVAHVWMTEGTYDKEFVASHTVGFEEFEEYVLGTDDEPAKTPAWAAEITKVPVHTIKALAREWAKKKTSLSVYFGGPKVRGTYSHVAARMEAYVLAMQGIGSPGRQFVRTGAPSFNKKWIAQVPRYPSVDQRGTAFNKITDYAIGKAPSSSSFVPRTLAAEAILDAPISWRGSAAALAGTEDQFVEYEFPPRPDHPGIKVVWNENGSQPGSWGHGWKWMQALRSPNLEFVVAVHPWMENDIGYSDLILPAQTNFEHEDLISVQRSDMLATFFQDRAIDPIGESKSDYEIHQMIAERLGAGAGFPAADDWLRGAFEETLAHTELGLSWDEFKERKEVVYDCPTWEEWVEIKKEFGHGRHTGGLHWFWAKGEGLETPSGKIEFVSREIAEKLPDDPERPPLARWLPHAEQAGSARSADYPLTVVSNHPRLRFHVQGDDVDWIRELGKVIGPDGEMYEPCWIHPSDAEPRGIRSSDVVAVSNERGIVLFGAIVTERIIPGSLCIEHGAKMEVARLDGHVVDRGGSINLIAPAVSEKHVKAERISIPEMNVSSFLVEIEKIDPALVEAGEDDEAVLRAAAGLESA